MKNVMILLVSLGLAAGTAIAADSIQGLQTHAQFETLRANVTKQLADPAGKYHEMSTADQKKVNETLDRMEQRWQSAGEGSPSQADMTELANEQEVVIGVLSSAAADSRVVCEREFPTGSNVPKNICKTVAQRRRDMQDSQAAMRTEQSRQNQMAPKDH
ncbi:MAG: hypothetical protein JSR34_07910 [Proteobacteria bacterium]|nr:hypothetical protein [Pseudomonadota bacterium]